MIKAPKIKPIDFIKNDEIIKLDNIILEDELILPGPKKRQRT